MSMQAQLPSGSDFAVHVRSGRFRHRQRCGARGGRRPEGAPRGSPTARTPSPGRSWGSRSARPTRRARPAPARAESCRLRPFPIGPSPHERLAEGRVAKGTGASGPLPRPKSGDLRPSCQSDTPQTSASRMRRLRASSELRGVDRCFRRPLPEAAYRCLRPGPVEVGEAAGQGRRHRRGRRHPRHEGCPPAVESSVDPEVRPRRSRGGRKEGRELPFAFCDSAACRPDRCLAACDTHGIRQLSVHLTANSGDRRELGTTQDTPTTTFIYSSNLLCMIT